MYTLTKHWTGQHRGFKVWHWIWLSHGNFHKHGYGPTKAIAFENAHRCIPVRDWGEELIPGFKRRF